jgi:hypothetical protein
MLGCDMNGKREEAAGDKDSDDGGNEDNEGWLLCLLKSVSDT